MALNVLVLVFNAEELEDDPAALYEPTVPTSAL